MQVAIYLDSHDAVLMHCAERCIESAQAFGYEAIHLTTLDGPRLLDNEIRLDVKGPFSYRRSILQSKLKGDTLILGADTVIREDVSGIFDEDFDICLTTDMRPGSDGIKYNGDVIFCRRPEIWAEFAEVVKDAEEWSGGEGWQTIEERFTRYMDNLSCKVKVLPGEEYNYVPDYPEDESGKIIHYRGGRKYWQPLQYTHSLNTPLDTMISQAKENITRPYFFLSEQPAHDGRAIIVAGGPSLNVDDFSDGTIFAVNGTHDYLIERGIIPDYHVLLDARADNVKFVENPHSEVTYLVSAQCHPDIFEKLDGHKIIMWLACFGEREDKDFAQYCPGVLMVGGGGTVGLKTLNIAHLLGFRDLELHGFDSSYGESHHAYPQPLNDGEDVIGVFAAGRHFTCAPWMAKQAADFQQQIKVLKDCKLTVCGDGLIPWIVRKRYE